MNSNTYICHESIKRKGPEAYYYGSPNLGCVSAGLLDIETEDRDNDIRKAAAVIVKVTIFWDVRSCSIVSRS
jgi:hypothetical protein